MLRELHIKNFSIIEDVTVEFENGFTVLTGETGAGKSIVINALSLALGERASSEVVRSGEKETLIEARFEISPSIMDPSSLQCLQDNGIEFENELIMKRIVSSQGRSRAYLNGSMVNVQTLADVSRYMIDVHGQYDHQSLLSQEHQRDLLDNYGNLNSAKEEVSRCYLTLLSVKQRISDLMKRDKERAQRLDLLEHQIREINSANLVTGEEESLTEEIRILSSAVQLAERANRAYDKLYVSDSACLTYLSHILNDLREIAHIDSSAHDALKSVEDALPLVEEAGYFLRDYKDSLSFDPSRLDLVQDRLETIRQLKRKYGSTIKEILHYADEAKNELETLQNVDETLKKLDAELRQIRADLTRKANSLSKKRKLIAKKIESEVIMQLRDLSMGNTKFSFCFSHESGDDTTDGLRGSVHGIDICEILISPNIGEELKPLAKIASGGELSRFMLSLKGVVAKSDRIPVLVFDEIDSGIGGKTAESVAKKLRKLSDSHQIICITHLPHIAAYADRHLRIEKKVERKRTQVEISEVTQKERTAEVARMLSGNVSAASLRHAEEMLKRVNTLDMDRR